MDSSTKFVIRLSLFDQGSVFFVCFFFNIALTQTKGQSGQSNVSLVAPGYILVDRFQWSGMPAPVLATYKVVPTHRDSWNKHGLAERLHNQTWTLENWLLVQIDLLWAKKGRRKKGYNLGSMPLYMFHKDFIFLKYILIPVTKSKLYDLT